MKFLFQLGCFFGCCSKRNFLERIHLPHKNGEKTGKIIDSNIPWRYSLVPILFICLSFFQCFKNNTNLIYSGKGPKGQLMGGFLLPPALLTVEISITQIAGRWNQRCRKRQSERRRNRDVFFGKPEDLSMVVASKIRGIDGSCFLGVF